MSQDDNHEQRLAQYKADLGAVIAGTARAEANVTNALAQMKQAYGCATIAEAQDMHNRVLREIPLLETKLGKVLDQADEVLHETEQMAEGHTDPEDSEESTAPPTATARGPLRGNNRGQVGRPRVD